MRRTTQLFVASRPFSAPLCVDFVAMSSRNVDIAVLAEILEEVLRDAASAMDLVSALPLPCRERIVAALVYQTRFCPPPAAPRRCLHPRLGGG